MSKNKCKCKCTKKESTNREDRTPKSAQEPVVTESTIILIFGKAENHPTRKTFIPVEIQVDEMYKRVTDYLFDLLQSRETPITQQEIVRHMEAFGGPNMMRQYLRDKNTSKLVLGPLFDEVEDMFNNNDPFALVLKKGTDIWATICLYEDEH